MYRNNLSSTPMFYICLFLNTRDFTCTLCMNTSTLVCSPSTALDIKVLHVSSCINNGMDRIYPDIHGWKNNHQRQNLQNAIRRMSSGKDAGCHRCTIKDTHKYDWRKRG